MPSDYKAVLEKEAAGEAEASEAGRAAEEVSRRVMPGLWTANWEGARRLVECGVAEKADLVPIVGHARWRPGQLEQEIARGSWALAAADAGVVISSHRDLRPGQRSTRPSCAICRPSLRWLRF